jgi:hypothetical protein
MRGPTRKHVRETFNDLHVDTHLRLAVRLALSSHGRHWSNFRLQVSVAILLDKFVMASSQARKPRNKFDAARLDAVKAIYTSPSFNISIYTVATSKTMQHYHSL